MALPIAQLLTCEYYDAVAAEGDLAVVSNTNTYQYFAAKSVLVARVQR